VIIGASRGGALALAIPDDRPLVLLAPAWRYFGVRPRIDAEGVVIHSPRDRIVPLGHSRELCRRCPGLRLVITGAEHRLNCPAGRGALARALDDVVGLPPL
jgi:pimeloyl-ACP methyl ester carboxylesterase